MKKYIVYIIIISIIVISISGFYINSNNTIVDCQGPFDGNCNLVTVSEINESNESVKIKFSEPKIDLLTNQNKISHITINHMHNREIHSINEIDITHKKYLHYIDYVSVTQKTHTVEDFHENNSQLILYITYENGREEINNAYPR